MYINKKNKSKYPCAKTFSNFDELVNFVKIFPFNENVS